MSVERRKVEILELQLDRCANTFGVAPCTATGTKCFNKRDGCKDKPNFVRTEGGQVLRFVSRGVQSPLALPLRPYVTRVDTAPTEIRPGVGLAIRAQQKVTLVDEPDNDTELDPYIATRALASTYSENYDDGSTASHTVVGTGATHSIVSGKYRLSTTTLNVGTSRFDFVDAHGEASVEFFTAVPTISDVSGNSGFLFCTTWWSSATPQSYGYEAQLRNTSVVLAKGSNSGAIPFASTLATAGHGKSAGTIVKYRIDYRDIVANGVIVGKRMQLFIDDVKLIDFTDTSTPWVRGQIGYRGFASSNQNWDFDDFTISLGPPARATSTFWRKLIARDPFMVGRMAKIYRGFEPNDGTALELADLQEELFVIDKVTGPDESGKVQVVLSDILKLADKAMLPLPTDGKLVAEVPARYFSGAVVSATPTTVTLPDDASAVDDAYNGAELLVIAGIGTGEGNRQVVADYVGATRTATLVGVWSVTPFAGSVIEVTPLSMTLNAGKAAQYNDPAVTLEREYVRIGDEVIEYTEITGDVLSWPNGSYRAKFGTERADHDPGEKVQQCKVYEDAAASDVIIDLLRAASIPDALIDLAGLAAEDEAWLASARITAQLTSPERVGEHLKEITNALNLMLWWDPLAQLVKGKVNAPEFDDPTTSISDGLLVQGGTKLDRLDDDRVTRVSIDFGLRSATANREEAKNFLYGKARIDTDAESANEYGPAGVRVNHTRSRWLSAVNEAYAEAVCARKLNWLRDAPTRVHARLDSDDEVELAELVYFTSRRLVDQFGNPKQIICRVVKLDQKTSHRDIDILSTNFAGRRWAFIAPNGLPNYPAADEDDKRYAYISPASGANFANGDPPYLII